MSHGDGTNQRPGNASNIADVPKLYDEIDRLRDEKSAIIKLISDRAETFHTEARRQAARDILDAILAKTAKEGE